MGTKWDSHCRKRRSFPICRPHPYLKTPPSLAFQPLPGQTLSSVTQTGLSIPCGAYRRGKLHCQSERQPARSSQCFPHVGYVIGHSGKHRVSRLLRWARIPEHRLPVNKNWKIFKERATINSHGLFRYLQPCQVQRQQRRISLRSLRSTAAGNLQEVTPLAAREQRDAFFTPQGSVGNSSATIGNAVRQLAVWAWHRLFT